ncbi:Uncharacterised protein [Vibrio cholerae]|nr:Uncharacterised protein [Vibrio cholerae]
MRFENINRDTVFTTTRHNDVCVLFRRLNKLHKHRAHRLLVLLQYRFHGATTLLNITLHTAQQADIQRRIHKYGRVHQIT